MSDGHLEAASESGMH